MKTSWQNVGKWYDKIVDKEGHYYHKNVILPYLQELLGKKALSLLDLACGQGVVERALPKNAEYVGVDIAKSLIDKAISRSKNKAHSFMVADVTEPLDIGKTFSHGTIVLAFQNLENPRGALANMKCHLKEDGTLILVLNHPCFRIPRQSSWGVDEGKKLQYRRIDRYLRPLKIPINMHPGETISYHHSLSDISNMLYEEGFCIERLDELCSDKKSDGKMAKREDFARQEFPLFLTIVAKPRR